MFATSMRGPTWPARLSYIAAGLFTLASTGTNLTYGWSKGTDTATSLVWATVSLAVSVVFALSWPAFIVSLNRRQWAQAVLVLIALIVTGAYSVSAALGSAMGGRTSAAIEERDAGNRKARAQTAYDTAKSELDTLTTAKPGAELQSLIDTAKSELTKLPTTRTLAELDAMMRRGCPARTALNGQVKAVCPKYDVELGRAWERKNLSNRIADLTNDIGRASQRHADQREKAKAAMEKAASELAHIEPAKVANSDAAALSVYLQGLGFTIDADRVNKLLVLLAVLVIECGSGLSLAVAMALDEGGLPVAERNRGAANGALTGSITPLAPEKAEPHKMPAVVDVSGAAGGSQQSEAPTRLKLLQMIARATGGLRTSERALGSSLGISSTRARRLLGELAAVGAIRLRSSSTGTTITLIEGGRA